MVSFGVALSVAGIAGPKNKDAELPLGRRTRVVGRKRVAIDDVRLRTRLEVIRLRTTGEPDSEDETEDGEDGKPIVGREGNTSCEI